MTASGKFSEKKRWCLAVPLALVWLVNQLREQGALVVAISRDPSKTRTSLV